MASRVAGVGWTGFNGRAHVVQPCVALGLTDGKRKVAHAEPGMTTLETVGRRPAPVLDQEEREVLLAGAEILRVERPKHGIGLHAGVEAVDQVEKEGPAADAVVQGG